MPNYQDHLLFGSFLVMLFSYFIGPYLSYGMEAVIVSAAFILLASIFPDVDHHSSVVHRKTRALMTLLIAAVPITLAYPNPVSMLVGGAAAAVGTYYTFELIKPKHRTVTHTFKAAAIFSIIVGAVSLYAFATFLPAVFTFIAYMSHLILDGTLNDL